jgi:hypothetical protein
MSEQGRGAGRSCDVILEDAHAYWNRTTAASPYLCNEPIIDARSRLSIPVHFARTGLPGGWAMSVGLTLTKGTELFGFSREGHMVFFELQGARPPKCRNRHSHRAVTREEDGSAV